MRINRHDTNGTKPLLGKGELGYDDYTAGGDTGRVYVGTGAENIAMAKRLESNMMTKAQFNALAEERKANRAGSGFDEWGKHYSPDEIVNEGITTKNSYINYFALGRRLSDGSGVSKTAHPVCAINGIKHIINNVATSSVISLNQIFLPTAPTIYPYDTVLTAEQIASGVIKHADASNSGLIVNGKNLTGTIFNQTIPVVNGKKYIIEYVDNAVRKTLEITASSTSYIISLTGTNITEVGMYPTDAISRSDLVFLESWHEDISEKNFVYPLGNVQYLGANTDGLTGIANGAFTGFETYSNFGVWQASSALIGKGYVWSSLTEAQKKAFIANPENNCYLDGDKVIQVRYRVRVVQGFGDNWVNIDPQSTVNNSLFSYSSTGGSESIVCLVEAKGKLTNVLDMVSSSSSIATYYGANHASQLGSTGVYAAGKGNALVSAVAYESKCYALPIALVHR